MLTGALEPISKFRRTTGERLIVGAEAAQALPLLSEGIISESHNYPDYFNFKLRFLLTLHMALINMIEKINELLLQKCGVLVGRSDKIHERSLKRDLC